MTLFDLLFLLVTFTTMLSLLAAAGLAVARRGQKSLRLLRGLGIGLLVYFAAIILVSLVSPRRTFDLGDAQCFDDFCIAATSAQRNGDSYTVGLRISSRARRVAQRERNLMVYLVDRANRRFDPIANPADTSLASLLEPGQAIDVTRTFPVPPSVRDVDLVITHGGFPIGWFIIGYDSWFRKPPLIRLRPATNSL